VLQWCSLTSRSRTLDAAQTGANKTMQAIRTRTAMPTERAAREDAVKEKKYN
jgi:hypothetical protein